jgi:hypothetical protein
MKTEESNKLALDIAIQESAENDLSFVFFTIKTMD